MTDIPDLIKRLRIKYSYREFTDTEVVRERYENERDEAADALEELQKCNERQKDIIECKYVDIANQHKQIEDLKFELREERKQREAARKHADQFAKELEKLRK